MDSHRQAAGDRTPEEEALRQDMFCFEERERKCNEAHAPCVVVRKGSVSAEAGKRHQPDPIHKGSGW